MPSGGLRNEQREIVFLCPEKQSPFAKQADSTPARLWRAESGCRGSAPAAEEDVVGLAVVLQGGVQCTEAVAADPVALGDIPQAFAGLAEV